MATMRAWVVERWGEPPVFREVPVPEPGPGEVLLRVRACGVGSTVLNIINGNLTNRDPAHLPRIPGHEATGEVAALGPGVSGFREGDRVLTYFYLTCGACPMCRGGRESLCQNFGGYLGAHRDGGYAEYLRVPARNCFRFPPALDFVSATAIPDAILTPLHISQSRARIRPFDRVVVVGGGGGIGIHLVQMARLFGAEVWGVDIGEAKLKSMVECGASGAFDFRETPAETMVEQMGGATVLVDFVGRPETLEWDFKVLSRGGTLVFVTTFPGIAVELSPREAVFKELTVMGSRYGSHRELEQAIELVSRGRIRPVIGEVAPIEAVERIHEKLRNGTLIGRGALTVDA